MGWQVDSGGTLLREHVVGRRQAGSPPVSPVRSCSEAPREDLFFHVLQEAWEEMCLGNLVSGNGNGPAVPEGSPSPPAAGSAGPRAAEET